MVEAGRGALLDLVRRHARDELPQLAILAGAAGLGNALVMAVANGAVSEPGEADALHLLLFALAVLIYALGQWATVRGSARVIEGVVHRLRVEILDRVRETDLVTLGRLDAGEVFAAVTRDTQAVSQAATLLSLGAQSTLLLAFTLLYLLWLSPVEFAVLLAAAAALAAALARRRRADDLAFAEGMGQERALLEDVSDLLDGIKEAKASPRRGAGLMAAIAAGTDAAARVKAAVAVRVSSGAVLMQAGVYLLIAALVFALPLLVVVEPEQRRRTVTALLFAVGSIAMLVQTIPQLAAADAAAADLVRLAERLPPDPAGAALLPSPGLAPVELRGVSFAWRDPAMGGALFQVGPLDLALRPGEVVFVTGGNGSGKSTLLRLAAGLLVPEAGTILLGGEAVTDANRQSYRDRVGAILGDLHLFRRPYGVAADPARVAALLEEYGLAGKVRLGPDRAWEGERALSGGQRKRLAMVGLLLEDPRIMVLDEWAADQDPAFRRRFYEEILPGFRAEGRAVLCATHDDRYFSAADRCYGMHDGRLLPMPQARGEDGV